MRQLRERVNLRTIDVAYHLGIAESTVRNWEKGRTLPKLRIDQFGELLRLYQCSFDDLENAIKESISKAQSDSNN